MKQLQNPSVSIDLSEKAQANKTTDQTNYLFQYKY